MKPLPSPLMVVVTAFTGPFLAPFELAPEAGFAVDDLRAALLLIEVLFLLVSGDVAGFFAGAFAFDALARFGCAAFGFDLACDLTAAFFAFAFVLALALGAFAFDFAGFALGFTAAFFDLAAVLGLAVFFFAGLVVLAFEAVAFPALDFFAAETFFFAGDSGSFLTGAFFLAGGSFTGALFLAGGSFTGAFFLAGGSFTGAFLFAWETFFAGRFTAALSAFFFIAVFTALLAALRAAFLPCWRALAGVVVLEAFLTGFFAPALALVLDFADFLLAMSESLLLCLPPCGIYGLELLYCIASSQPVRGSTAKVPDDNPASGKRATLPDSARPRHI